MILGERILFFVGERTTTFYLRIDHKGRVGLEITVEDGTELWDGIDISFQTVEELEIALAKLKNAAEKITKDFEKRGLIKKEGE